MWCESTRCIALFALLAITVEAGLLRVPKIYNTVITSDANLEPSRAFPIVQPVLTVGVQPVVAAPPVQHHPTYYPYGLGGLYPFLAGTNALYPSPVLYQPAYAADVLAQTPANNYPANNYPADNYPAASYSTASYPTPAASPAPTRTAAVEEEAAPAPARPQQIPPMPVGDLLNNNHRQHPEIPDVPPPPLPVSASKKT